MKWANVTAKLNIDSKVVMFYNHGEVQAVIVIPPLRSPISPTNVLIVPFVYILLTSENVDQLTWTNCRKIDCYCLYEVEVTQVHLPPSPLILSTGKIRQWRRTSTEIRAVSIAIYRITCQAIFKCSTLTGSFPNRCLFYSTITNKQTRNLAIAIRSPISIIWDDSPSTRLRHLKLLPTYDILFVGSVTV